MAVGHSTFLHTSLLEDDQDGRRGPQLPALSILRPGIVLLAVAATLIALAAIVQYLGNHSGGGSLRGYYYADATIEALAYGCVTAGFFVSWILCSRSRATRDFSFSFMLVFLGAACVTTQWICTLIVYVLDFSTPSGASVATTAALVKHLVDAAALLQLAGWSIVAGAILLSFRVLVGRSKRSAALSGSPLGAGHVPS
jgi:hypothetical protein